MRLFGRVTDVRERADGAREIIALSGDAHEVFGVPADVADPPRPGDVIEVEVDAARNATNITILLRPESGTPMFDGDVVRWRGVRRDGSRLERLRARDAMLRAVRALLATEEFLEVQVPLLVRGTCPDVHIDSVEVPGHGYLTTSTEYQIKRLMVGGVERAYTLTQNFRAGDVGRTHNPEFTMLEWARVGAGMREIERDAREIVLAAARAAGRDASAVRFGDATVDLVAPWERQSVREAMRRHLGVAVDEDYSLPSLQRAVEESRVAVPDSSKDDRSDLVTCLLDAMQPALGRERPTFLVEWPAFLTASAPAVPGAPHVAERSELFIAGLEIADGFPFLTDRATQRASFAAAQDARRRAGKEAVTVDDAYLRALAQGLPPGAGMALGFDRLAMLLTGSADIRDVLAFAWDER